MSLFSKKHVVSAEHARAWSAASTGELTALHGQLEAQRDRPGLSGGEILRNAVSAFVMSPESFAGNLVGGYLGQTERFREYLPQRAQGSLKGLIGGTILGAAVAAPVALVRYNGATRSDKRQQAAADLGFVEKVLEDRVRSTARLTADASVAR